MQQSTTYIHHKLTYFFSKSQTIDIEIGNKLAFSINYCLDVLQQNVNANGNVNGSQANEGKNKLLEACMSLLSHLVTANNVSINSNKQTQTEPYQPYNPSFTINPQSYVKFTNSNGLQTCLTALKGYLQLLASPMAASSTKITLVDEMIVKELINIVYVAVYGFGDVSLYYNGEGKANENKGNLQIQWQKFKKLIQELQLDALLIKMVTLTLQAFYLPIKKLVMLYTRTLSILFIPSSSTHPQSTPTFYEDSDMLQCAMTNLLSQDYLHEFKEKNRPEDIRKKAHISPVQQFYAKHNVGDCPLAQSIVVGLLRSLLTICNSQAHKRFQLNPSKGSGADSYRQWQITYQWLLQPSSTSSTSSPFSIYKAHISPQSQLTLKSYQQYNQSTQQSSTSIPTPSLSSSNNNNSNIPGLISMHYQFYRHKIYTTSSISTFFIFLLMHFHRNAKIQFTYLYQLISDANGILVFLKFLTDKFEMLEPPQQKIVPQSQSPTNINTVTNINSKGQFKQEVMLTVYSVLLVLYGACNNYAQKTRSYLFQYNSYLIIKKIPHIFMTVHKNDDQLPSQEQIQAQFGIRPIRITKQSSSTSPASTNAVNQVQQCEHSKVRELTQLCYSLLKIQIPFFSKKMKQNTNNMKMIIQIYCQMPKKPQPITRTQLDKLLLKNQMRKIQQQKYILSVQQLKNIHNQYNNMYYWCNEQAKIAENNQIMGKSMMGMGKDSVDGMGSVGMSRQEMEKWLEDNVWKFYD